MHDISRKVVHSVKKGISHFSSMQYVFDKLEDDGHLSLLSATLTHILSLQPRYAVSELLKVKEKDPELDLPHHLITNSAVFKENLKAISGMMSLVISRCDLGRENSNRTKRNPQKFYPTKKFPAWRNQRRWRRKRYQLKSLLSRSNQDLEVRDLF